MWPVFVMGTLAMCTTQPLHKAFARANRLAVLMARPVESLEAFEQKELQGLLRQDTYDESKFSTEHAAFKAAHNAVFVQLAQHCGGLGGNLFYLDGPNGRTTQSLLAVGMERSQLYTANWYPTTCASLMAPPHSLPECNVAASRAGKALSDDFRRTSFKAVFLDGCGGAVEPLTECIEVLFKTERTLPSSFAIGFTLTDAEPTGRPLADREADVHRAIASACRAADYRFLHVWDEPHLFGVDARTSKRDAGTLTSWHVCTRPHVALGEWSGG